MDAAKFGCIRAEGGTLDPSHLDYQDFVDQLAANGLSGQTIDNILMPLRVIYRRAVKRGQVAVNPTRDLEIPATDAKVRRAASPSRF